MSNVSIFLIKENFQIVDRFKIINDQIIENRNSVFDKPVCLFDQQRIEQHLLSLKLRPKRIRKASSDVDIYYRNRKKQEPDWKTFWNIDEDIFVRTADAIVFLKIQNRTFAICHGRSSGLINPYAITVNFGLITALNAIDPNKINSTDIFTPNETALQTRKKTSKSTKLSDYNLDIFSSLLKNVSGKAKKEYEHLASSINGADSFKLSLGTSKDTLIKRITEIYKIYKLDTYKTNEFKWVDNFRPIKERVKIEELDQKLINALIARDRDIQIFIPTNLDYSGSYCYKFSGLGKRSENVFNNLWPTKTLYAVLDRTKKTFSTIDDFKNARISIYTEDDLKHDKETFALYNCIYFEIVDGNGWYFIESGNWYYVKEEFTKDFEDYFNDLKSKALSLPLTYVKNALKRKYHNDRDKNFHYENWFNQELVELFEKSGNRATLLDAKNIQIKGYDKIEVCDVLSKSKEGWIYLFHNKYNSGSSVLSHLFGQANVSAELLTKPDFRILVNDKIMDDELKFPIDSNFDSRKYTIIVGIISKKNAKGDFGIPLFSKINLQLYADRIKSKSFNLRLCFFEEQ